MLVKKMIIVHVQMSVLHDVCWVYVSIPYLTSLTHSIALAANPASITNVPN